MLDSARRRTPVPTLARWLLGLGTAPTLAANVAHGLGHGLVGAAVAAWPALALVGPYELLMVVTRQSQVPEDGMSEAHTGAGLVGAHREPTTALVRELAAEWPPGDQSDFALITTGPVSVSQLGTVRFAAIEAGRSRHRPFEMTALIFWCE